MVEPMKLGDYMPTVGLRILESERTVPAGEGEATATVQIQLWDVSGDVQYEEMAKRVAGQLDAVIIVVPAAELDPVPTVRKYYNLYVDPGRVGTPGLVCVFSHRATTAAEGDVFLNDAALSVVPVHRTCLDTKLEAMMEALDDLVRRAHAAKTAAENEFLNDLL